MTAGTTGRVADPGALPTGDDIRASAGRLVDEQRVILPVRHHSPACARQVRAAIDRYRPAAVLVEGPRDFTPLIDTLTADDARAPLAIYAYLDPATRRPDAPRLGAYFPFCDFSPELVALREARARALPARFIDLNLGEQHAADHGGGTERSLVDEHHFSLSARLARLTEQLGCRDEEDLWELLFEADAATVDLDEHLARMTAYCLLARADATPASLRDDGTAAREAEMEWQVRQAISEFGPTGPVLVVVGGFHAVALPDLLVDPPERPVLRAPAEHTALIRFGFDRVDAVSGYAAGITAPAWQQRVWEQLDTGTRIPGSRAAAAREMLLDIGAALDAAGRGVSQPTVADALTHTAGLAALRDHPGPLRSDLLDAIRACLVKGDADTDGAGILAVAEATLRGDRVGTVPAGAPAPPLVADTLERLRRARLEVDGPLGGRLALGLYRSAAHRITSRLLHGLTELGVPFAELLSGPDLVGGRDLHLITEQWAYRWSPATEAALVEAARYGASLPDAVAAHFDERVADFGRGGRHPGAAASAELLLRACRLGLTDRADALIGVVEANLAADPSFCGVVAAASTLALVRHAREPLDAGRLTGLPALITTAIERALFLGRTLPAEEPTEVVEALVSLREVLTDPELAADQIPTDLYDEVVAAFSDRHPDGFVRGGSAGIRYSTGLLDGEALAGRVSGALAGTLAAEDAVAVLRGVLRTAREAAWQEPAIIGVVGDGLSHWPADRFGELLPSLRLAFADLTPREVDRVATVVAGRLGRSGLGPLQQPGITAEEVGANLAASARAAGLLTVDGLGGWLAPGEDRREEDGRVEHA